MILSFSGRINSGKDLCGQITQHLITHKKCPINEDAIEDVMNCLSTQLPIDNSRVSGFYIKKWADKLKEIVALMIGCSREQLEDNDFKNTVLPEAWWYYQREDMMYDYLEFRQYEDKNEGIAVYSEDLVKPTVRMLLQRMGTDAMRNHIHPNVHINMLLSEYKPVSTETHYSQQQIEDLGNLKSDRNLPNVFTMNYPNWIITDTRFPNELAAVKRHGGLTIRVTRPIREPSSPIKSLLSRGVAKRHCSETALDNATFDEEIINDGTIEELIEKVRAILIKYKIIEP